jgi:hypothetical protein
MGARWTCPDGGGSRCAPPAPRACSNAASNGCSASAASARARVLARCVAHESGYRPRLPPRRQTPNLPSTPTFAQRALVPLSRGVPAPGGDALSRHCDRITRALASIVLCSSSLLGWDWHARRRPQVSPPTKPYVICWGLNAIITGCSRMRLDYMLPARHGVQHDHPTSQHVLTIFAQRQSATPGAGAPRLRSACTARWQPRRGVERRRLALARCCLKHKT